MGERGKLKLPRHLSPIKDNTAGTVADEVPPGVPGLPEGFGTDKDMIALWNQLVPELDKAGLLASTDGMAIEMTIRHFLAARMASEELLDQGAWVDDAAHSGVKRNPADGVFMRNSAQFREYVKLLGMAFASRARIPGHVPETGGDDFFVASGS